jgi:hypothetical protein
MIASTAHTIEGLVQRLPKQLGQDKSVRKSATSCSGVRSVVRIGG